MLSIRNGTALALVGVILLVTAACERGDSEESNAPLVTQRSPSATPVSGTEPFFLDLRTGEKTPLPENLAGGYAYVPSPDGQQVIYGGDCTGTSKTRVADIDGTNVHRLRSPTGLNICGARWSPDGTKLVYQERNGRSQDDVGNIFVHDLSSGHRIQLTDLELKHAWWWFLSPSFGPGSGDTFSAATGPDDVVFHLPRRSSETTKWDVWSVSMGGRAPTRLLRNATFPILRGEGPEGERIVFLLPARDDLAGKSIMRGRPFPGADLRRKFVDADSQIWWPRMSPDGDRIAYQDGGFVYVADVFTGETSKVAAGQTAEWLDDHTLIVAPA